MAYIPHIHTTEDFYGPSDDWNMRDYYSIFRFLTHAFGWAPRSKTYAQELAQLDFSKMPAEVLAIAKPALEECPMGKDFLSETSLKAIQSAKPLKDPIKLSPGTNERCAPEPYRSMGVYL